MNARQLVSVNGAEWLDVEVKARVAGRTIPQQVRALCGLAARGVVGGTVPREDTSTARRPIRALERRAITVPLTDPEREQLVGEARQAATTLAQYMRTRCGFKPRNSSLPGTDEREDEEDDAWEILNRLGLNPQDYFPPNE